MLLLALLLSLCMPTLLHAHGALRTAVPASGARLAAVPRELRLTFTERVELSVTRVTLAGPDGAAVGLTPVATVVDSANVVVTAIRGALRPGAYTVSWQVAGRDGHPVRGSYTFTILAGATGFTGTGADTVAAPAGAPGAPPQPAGEAGATVTPPGQTPPPAAHHPASTFPVAGDFDAESPVYVVVRWLTYAALLVVLGAVAFRTVVLRLLRGASAAAASAPDLVRGAARRAATLGVYGASALLVVALARLAAQSVAMHGTADALDPARIASMLRQTVWGWGWLLQVGAGVLAVVGLAGARRQERDGTSTAGGAWVMATIAAVILALTPALSGHAAAAPRLMPLAILSDGLHVVGAGGWLGSLLMVLAAGVPAAFALGAERRGAAVAALVNAFSPTALVFAAIVSSTGLFAAWLHVGRVAALWESDYGRVLLVKLAILSLVAATGAYNWLRVRPALGDDTGTTRIGRSATTELVIGALVLLATGVLVATPTPTDDAMAGSGRPSPEHTMIAPRP